MSQTQMNVSLTQELAELVKRKVASGRYNNASEVVRDALRRLEEYDAWQELREFLAPRIAAAKRGEGADQLFDEIIAEARQKKSGQ